MWDVVGDIFELIIGPFFEWIINCSMDRRKPLIMRLPAMTFSILIWGGLATLLFVLGIIMYKEILIIGIIFFIVDIILLRAVLKMYISAYKRFRHC